MFDAHFVPVSSRHPVGQENTASSQGRLCLQLGQHQWAEATESWKKTRLNSGVLCLQWEERRAIFTPNPVTKTNKQLAPCFLKMVLWPVITGKQTMETHMMNTMQGREQ